MGVKHYLKRWNRDTQVHDLIPCAVLERNRRRPLRKKGQRLGSWTNKFYKDMSYISFTVGRYHHRTWVKTCRITTACPVIDTTDGIKATALAVRDWGEGGHVMAQAVGASPQVWK
jgi:hypothetical protein